MEQDTQKSAMKQGTGSVRTALKRVPWNKTLKRVPWNKTLKRLPWNKTQAVLELHSKERQGTRHMAVLELHTKECHGTRHKAVLETALERLPWNKAHLEHLVGAGYCL